MKKLISLVLALSMLVTFAAVFASCNEKNDGPKEDPDFLTIVKDGKSDYVIVRGDNASQIEKSATVALKNAIEEKCGVELDITTDYIPRNEENPVIPKLEIIVGKTTRKEAEGLTEGLGEMGFIIKVVDKKLIICGVDEKRTENAVGYFIRNYLAEETDTLKIEKSLSEEGIGDYIYCVDTGLTYEEMARDVYSDFMKKFWKGKWVQGSGFWDAAEILETFIDAYEATKDEQYLTYVKEYSASFESKNGSNWLNNEFNDDVMWITIAYLRIYNLTGEKSYYNQAKKMYDGVYARAWSDDLGGGLFWKTDNGSKNACVNCPGAIAACLIAEISKDEKYTQQAEDIIAWVTTTLYGGKGYVYDSVSMSGSYNKWASTYNQGTFIGACTLLHKLTGDEKYKVFADDAVLYTMKNMFNYGVINSEGGENKDLHGFKGILTRWIYRYAVEYNNLEVLEWLQLNAQTAYSNSNKSGLIWTEWKNKSEDWSGAMPSKFSVFGYSTAVSLMFNSLQWWDSEQNTQNSN